jgi:hypothetical protein
MRSPFFMTITSVLSRAKRGAARRREELRIRARMLMEAPVLHAVLNPVECLSANVK